MPETQTLTPATTATDLDIRIVVVDPAMTPAYENPGDAGADLRSAIDTVIPARGWTTIPTGVSAAIPTGYALFVDSRSGLAAKNGVAVLNSPGVVDSGYRGEIGVVLFNISDRDLPIKREDRIAQAVIQKVERANFVVVKALEDLGETERGTGGFGSTGLGA